MKCDAARALQGAYLDSELDTRSTIELEQHLKECAECARLFAEETGRERRMRAALNRGEKTAALWQPIEQRVARADAAAAAERHGVLEALRAHVRTGWQRSRWAWSAIAAAWAVILTLSFLGREPQAPLTMAQSLPRPAELRLALKQKQLLYVGLAALSESRPTPSAKANPPSPRSERQQVNLNV